MPYAPSGRVSVTTLGGTGVSPEVFTVIGGPPPPAIVRVSPTSGPSGIPITITVTNAAPATGVLFNGTPAQFTRGTLALSANPIGQNQIMVTWPITDQPLVLQAADSPLRTATWADVTTPVTVVDGHNSISVPMNTARQFYRLLAQ